jgi:23S rRNA (cytosine1962-C5)-methyltransferase
MTADYQLLDSGGAKKFERFGRYSLIRPCPQALWRPRDPNRWKEADAIFCREKENRWEFFRELPASWTIAIEGVECKIALTDFGHLGVFPEHAQLWRRICTMIRPKDRFLNLFAYSGGATLSAAKEGAQVCHLDASKGMVDWARENCALNKMEKAPIRWIVDDAIQFLKREVKRGSLYEGILADPPTFGRGNKGQVFQIERDLSPLIDLCQQVLSPEKKFFILSCHTPGITPLALQNLLGPEKVEAGEMTLRAPNTFDVPCGCFAVRTYG